MWQWYDIADILKSRWETTKIRQPIGHRQCGLKAEVATVIWPIYSEVPQISWQSGAKRCTKEILSEYGQQLTHHGEMLLVHHWELCMGIQGNRET